jgi:hypothetical protein
MMALYLSIPDLKEIKSIYQQLGLSNSAVLDQIKTAINSAHFTNEDVEEILDVAEDYRQAIEKQNVSLGIDPKTLHAIEQVKLLQMIHMKAKGRVA